MTPHELMVKTNHYLIKGGKLTFGQKQNIVGQFLSAISTKEEAERFYQGVKFPNNTDSTGRRMYPVFFIPPYKNVSGGSLGKKYKTILGQTPKTHIFSANMYELEILRLLQLFAPENPDVQSMVSQTLDRLKTTCFGNMDDGIGECYDTSLFVLRFLAVAAPDETKWIKERIGVFYRYLNDHHRIWCTTWYFWLCLSELPQDIAIPEIWRNKDLILRQLNRSYVMNSEHDKEIHPVIKCIERNCMARLPGYEYIEGGKPFVNPKDGRLCIDMDNWF